MLRAVLKTNLRLWEECLLHIEFAYNRYVHLTIKLDAFQRAEFIIKIHETTKINIEKMKEIYRIASNKGRKEVILEPGDLVWVHLRKERFPELRKSKLM